MTCRELSERRSLINVRSDVSGHEDGMPDEIYRVAGDCRNGCGQTLEIIEHGAVECCVCGATRQAVIA